MRTRPVNFVKFVSGLVKIIQTKPLHVRSKMVMM